MKDMKHTLRITILVVLFCAAAVQSWANFPNPTITKGYINGGTVKIYAQDPTTNTSQGEIQDAPAGKTVYLVAEADYQHTIAGIDWRVMKSGRSSVAQSRTRSVDYAAEITVTNVPGNVYSFTMPTGGESVTVSATFAEKAFVENVAYITSDGSDGKATKAYVLDGTETVLGEDGKEMWYISNTTGNGLAYNSQIMIKGNVHLILADNSSMTVTIANDHPIYIYQGSADNPNRLHIYGQGGTTEGKLTATSESGDAINGNFNTELIINGGTINATGSSGIKVTGSGTVTINGGNITATSIGNNDHPYGIYGSNGITINGGQVTATSTGGGYGIATTNSYITLGFSKTTDFIFANSYNTSSSNLVKTADGQRFAAYNMASEGDLSVSAIVSGSSMDSNPVSFTLDDIAGKTLRPIAVAEPDGQGGTTVSPGYLLSIVPGDMAPADKTDNQGQPAPDFTITTGTGDSQVTTPYYIYKAGSEGTTIPLSVPDYGQQGADFTVSIDGAAASALPDAAVTGSGETVTAALPWTGANDVELKSARYYCTGVSYMDWDDAQKKLVPATTSTAAGAVTKVYILTGGDATVLPGGWYVVKNWNTSESNNSGIDAFYTGTVNFTGDTHLILADGAIMSIGTRNATINGNGIHFEPGSLTIYAQGTGPDMGTLNTFPSNGYSGIQALSSPSETSITINGGNITCESSNATGIEVWNYQSDASIIINGGKVTVTGTDMKNGILTSSYYNSRITINDGIVDLNVSTTGICVENTSSTNSTSTLSVLGGKVVDYSEHGFSSYTLDGVAEIILGWKNTDDYIYTKKYSEYGDVRTVSGQYLMACSSADGTGPAYGGKLDATGIAAINGKYLRPAMYTITAPENCNLSVADNVGTVDPVTVGSGDAAKTYYLYDPDNTVTASLKNESFVGKFSLESDAPYFTPVTFDDGTTGFLMDDVHAIAFTMPDNDLEINCSGVSVPSGGKKYLAFVDNDGNLTTGIDDVIILVFLGLDKDNDTGAIVAIFKRADAILDGMTLNTGDENMIPEGLPVIFANYDDSNPLPANIGVAEPTSANADDAAETIRQAASPLFMTGTTGQSVADVLRAALTDAAGNPLLDSNNLPLSLDAADYVIFLFDTDRFVPVAASASSKLSGRRYLLVVDKLTLLSLLNAPAPGSSARAASRTDRVWTFPLMIGGNDTGITNLTLDPDGTATDPDWYTLEGRRLDSRPTAKGVYIRKGHKEVIR